MNKTVTNGAGCHDAGRLENDALHVRFHWIYKEPAGPVVPYTLRVYNNVHCTGSPLVTPQNGTGMANCWMLGNSWGYAEIYNGTSGIIYTGCNGNCSICSHSTWVTRMDTCSFVPEGPGLITYRVVLDWTAGVPPGSIPPPRTPQRPPPPSDESSATTVALSFMLVAEIALALLV
jgi:hypothetical protein